MIFKYFSSNEANMRRSIELSPSLSWSESVRPLVTLDTRLAVSWMSGINVASPSPCSSSSSCSRNFVLNLALVFVLILEK